MRILQLINVQMTSFGLDTLLKINVLVDIQRHIIESDYIFEVENGAKFN